MKATITFEIECGEMTCASEPGKFCQFLRAELNGACSCHLFGKLWDTDGWVQRHQDCLNMAENVGVFNERAVLIQALREIEILAAKDLESKNLMLIYSKACAALNYAEVTE